MFSFLLSCVREEMVPYNKATEVKIVVIGFLTPAADVNIYVGRSQIFGKTSYQFSDFDEPDAVVTITDETGRMQLLKTSPATPSIYSCSQTDFPIVPGKTYSLIVKGANRTVSATTLVPKEAAKWKSAALSGEDVNGYFMLSGSWDAQPDQPNVTYAINVEKGLPRNFLERINEGINKLGSVYTVKRDVFRPTSNRLDVFLLTQDKSFGNFSRKTDLTLDIYDNLHNSAFRDVISSFKGVIPDAGNINGGIGVFGSYLKDVKKLYK